jgi:hypothetical protein
LQRLRSIEWKEAALTVLESASVALGCICDAAFTPDLWSAELDDIAPVSSSASAAALIVSRDGQRSPRHPATRLPDAALNRQVPTQKWRDSDTAVASLSGAATTSANFIDIHNVRKSAAAMRHRAGSFGKAPT